MSHKSVLIAILFLLIGLLLGYSLSVARTGVRFDEANKPLPVADHSMHRMMGDMSSKLDGKSGTEFDLAFLDEMTVHHQGAIDMARKVLERSQNDELRAFAQEIIDAQGAEIEQMGDWKAEWSAAATATSTASTTDAQR